MKPDRAPLLARMAHGAIRNRIARGPLKKPLRRYMASVGMHVDVCVDGLRMRCHLGDNRTEQAIAEGRYNAALANVEAITERLPAGGVFVDIGANCGLFTVFAARRVGASGKVVAIEALLVMQDRTAANVALNGFSNVRLARCAVGAEAGQIIIHARPTQYGESGAAGGIDSVPHAVPMKPLAQILVEAGVDRVDALKIDIEGQEASALLPFFRTAPASMWPRCVLIEIKHRGRWNEDVLHAMALIGYRTEWANASDAFLSRDERRPIPADPIGHAHDADKHCDPESPTGDRHPI